MEPKNVINKFEVEGIEDAASEEEELDNAIKVLVSEKKVWENAFNLAKLELDEKNNEIENLKKLLSEINSGEVNNYNKTDDNNLLRSTLETSLDSNKVIINGKSDDNSNSQQYIKCNNNNDNYLISKFIKIAKEEAKVIGDIDDIISRLTNSEDNIESLYRNIIRAYVELRLENQSLDQRISSLNEELSNAQEAVQSLHRTIQNNQNSSDLISVAYTSQIKSLQDDLLSACKDIDFWKEQCEQYMKSNLDRNEVNSNVAYSDLDLGEWCNLGSGVDTMYRVEVVPNSYWWFISF